MSRLFELTDNHGAGHSVGADFLLTNSTPSNFNILRIISGNVSITNLDTGNCLSNEHNFLADNYIFDSSLSFEQNLCKILNDSIEVEDLKAFFFDRRYNVKNREFFSRLENEFCNFLTYTNKGSFTTAFIFLYRILEVISFSFPLIYASKTYDFKHTYGKLKEMFESNNGTTKGELGFLKSAVKVMFSESELMNTSVDIMLEDEHEKNVKIFAAVKGVIKEPAIYHTDTVENSKISVCFGEVSSFIIMLRNRFFHLFNRGDKNLESIEIIDPDYFFSKMNAPLFGWMCIVYVEITKFLLEEHEKYSR